MLAQGGASNEFECQEDLVEFSRHCLHAGNMPPLAD
jgi:hypothetical protein